MKISHFALVAAATLCGSAARAQSIESVYHRTSPAESFDAVFTNLIGATTSGSYSGLVEVNVSGRGSIGPGLADAFYSYGYDDGGDYYDLALGTPAAPLRAFHPEQSITHDIVFADGVGVVVPGYRPARSGSFTYRFVVDLRTVGVVAPTTLQFGVTEGDYADNRGAYQLTIYQLAAGPAVAGVPEPAAWTLMIAGFGLAGVAMRRRRRPEPMPQGV